MNFRKDRETIQTIESYSTGAHKYIEMTDQLSYFEGLQNMLDRFINLLPGDKVLDIAFGSGRDILYLLNKGLDVQGLELTQEFITILRQKVDIPLHHMDMRELNFPNNSFDGIWCCSSFLHIPKQDALKTLAGFSKILQPKGVLFLSLKEGIGEEWINKGNVEELARFFSYYSYNEIQNMLEKTNFRILYEERQANRNIDKPTWLSLISCKID